MKKEIKLLPVIGNKPEAKQYWEELLALGVKEDYENPDAILAPGGDGWILRTERDYYKSGIPIIGIGFGTRNFLLNRTLRDPKKLVDALERNEWVGFEMQGMQVYMETGGNTLEGIAFNDVYIKSTDPTGVVYLQLDTVEYPNKKVDGDGIIIATPQGSTAYNRTAGGTILPLGSKQWTVTGICTNQKLHATINHQEVIIRKLRGDIVVVTDNKVHYGFQGLREYKIETVRIVPSEYSVRILFDPNENFEQRRYNEE